MSALSRRAATAALLALLTSAGAACRNADGVAGDAAAPDLQATTPMCGRASDCLACCAAVFESGALVYGASLMSCACTASSCEDACGSTVCGSGLGVDAPCRACLAGAVVDGGVCAAATNDCLVGDGPCAAFADCVAACPN